MSTTNHGVPKEEARSPRRGAESARLQHERPFALHREWLKIGIHDANVEFARGFAEENRLGEMILCIIPQPHAVRRGIAKHKRRVRSIMGARYTARVVQKDVITDRIRRQIHDAIGENRSVDVSPRVGDKPEGFHTRMGEAGVGSEDDQFVVGSSRLQHLRDPQSTSTRFVRDRYRIRCSDLTAHRVFQPFARRVRVVEPIWNGRIIRDAFVTESELGMGLVKCVDGVAQSRVLQPVSTLHSFG